PCGQPGDQDHQYRGAASAGRSGRLIHAKNEKKARRTCVSRAFLREGGQLPPRFWKMLRAAAALPAAPPDRICWRKVRSRPPVGVVREMVSNTLPSCSVQCALRSTTPSLSK